MEDKRVSEMTDAEIQEQAGARPVSCWQVQGNGRTWLDARDRYDELTQRDLLARARTKLRASARYDPEKHGSGRDPEPLTLHECLEVLANGEAVARVYRHSYQVHHALEAGASWKQVAEATGTDEAKVRQEYRRFAEGQHHLWQQEGKWGLNDAQYQTAIARTDPQPESEAGS